MREIKLRAWVKDIYDNAFMLYLKPNITWRDVENGLVVAYTEDGEDYGYAEVSKENPNIELMEYTGLKDKNGKEIYEGDVTCRVIDVVQDVIGGYERTEPEGQIETVEFKNGGWFVGDEMLWEWAEEIEVIGTVYENPELLK